MFYPAVVYLAATLLWLGLGLASGGLHTVSEVGSGQTSIIMSNIKMSNCSSILYNISIVHMIIRLTTPTVVSIVGVITIGVITIIRSDSYFHHPFFYGCHRYYHAFIILIHNHCDDEYLNND